MNHKAHSSPIYNAFQYTVAGTSAFSGGYVKTATCFVAGTLVATINGLAAIETIKAGDYVLSTDPDTMKTEYKQVLETYIRKVDRLVHLIISGEEIITTVDHPFYVQGRGFIEAGNLLVGDKLIIVNGEDLIIEDYHIELTEEPVSVYNFQVEDFHTYHVGKNGVLVHNADYTTASDWAGKTDELAKTSPIDIPQNASVKISNKAAGYDQISFKWTENGCKFEARWHTRTPGAPIEQGNTWVVTRTTPGTPTGLSKVQHVLIGENTWVTRADWQSAINAYQNGSMTAEQSVMLDSGHWDAP